MRGRLSCVVHGPIYSRFIYSRFSLYRGTQRQFSEISLQYNPYTLYFECYATMPMLAYLWYF